MSTMLDDKTRSIVSACVPALEAHGLDITHEMYRRLLANPEIRDLFNMSHQKDGEQPKLLPLPCWHMPAISIIWRAWRHG